MKTGYSKFFWLIILAGAFLIANTVFAQNVIKKYVYQDYDSDDTVYKKSNHSFIVMPASAADGTGIVGVKYIDEKGLDKSQCIMISFGNLKEPPRWAGVVFPVKANYFGEKEAEVEKEAETEKLVLNLERARKLVFYAKGENGGERIQVKAAFAGDKPKGDSALFPVISRWLTLGKDWSRYEVPIDNPGQLTRVITPFAVIASLAYNPGGAITIYLDEIYYELEN